ncbi:MAG TPA: tyrosine-type recombinase/integrase [Candidatus Paceibacterota bacterium]
MKKQIGRDIVPEICDRFLDSKEKIEKKSPETIASYSNDLKLIYNFIMKAKGISKIDIDFIKSLTKQDYYDFLGSTDVCENTKKRRIRTLSSFYNWLYEDAKLIDEDTLYIPKKLKTGKIIKRKPKFPNSDEAKDILEVSKKTKFPSRDYCIIVFFMNTGLRLSELTDLQLGDIKDGILTVMRGKGDKERDIPLSDACLLPLKEYLINRPKTDTKQLFIQLNGSEITSEGMAKMVKRVFNKAYVDVTKLHTHSLRHFFGNTSQENDIPLEVIQKMMGHTDLKTTQIYSETSKQRLIKYRNAVNIS